jgi:hypothetical protein
MNLGFFDVKEVSVALIGLAAKRCNLMLGNTTPATNRQI